MALARASRASDASMLASSSATNDKMPARGDSVLSTLSLDDQQAAAALAATSASLLSGSPGSSRPSTAAEPRQASTSASAGQRLSGRSSPAIRDGSSNASKRLSAGKGINITLPPLPPQPAPPASPLPSLPDGGFDRFAGGSHSRTNSGFTQDGRHRRNDSAGDAAGAVGMRAGEASQSRHRREKSGGSVKGSGSMNSVRRRSLVFLASAISLGGDGTEDVQQSAEAVMEAAQRGEMPPPRARTPNTSVEPRKSAVAPSRQSESGDAARSDRGATAASRPSTDQRQYSASSTTTVSGITRVSIDTGSGGSSSAKPSLEQTERFYGIHRPAAQLNAPQSVSSSKTNAPATLRDARDGLVAELNTQAGSSSGQLEPEPASGRATPSSASTLKTKEARKSRSHTNLISAYRKSLDIIGGRSGTGADPPSGERSATPEASSGSGKSSGSKFLSKIRRRPKTTESTSRQEQPSDSGRQTPAQDAAAHGLTELRNGSITAAQGRSTPSPSAQKEIPPATPSKSARLHAVEIPATRRRSNSLTSPKDGPQRVSQDGGPRPGSVAGVSPRKSEASRLDDAGGAAALFGGGSGGKAKKSGLLPGLFGGQRSRSMTTSGATTPARSEGSSTPAPQRPPLDPAHGSRPGTGLSMAGDSVTPSSSQGDSLWDHARPSVDSRRPSRKDAVDSAGPPPVSIPSGGKIAPRDGDTPETFTERVSRKVNKSEVAVILSSSGHPFYQEALQACLRRFQFAGNALDIALRKLLMEICLPKETQQIDRVMEAFAIRYNECNEGLFASADQPYILAFSLMMLHTDAFNKNAKQKMSKADYVKNAASSEVATEVLEYLYDNLTLTEFIYVDDDANYNHRRPSEASASKLSVLAPPVAANTKNKIDTYLIISQGRTHDYAPNIEHLIPEDSPFSLCLDYNDLDIDVLRRCFTNAPTIEIVAPARGNAAVPLSPGLSNNLVPNPTLTPFVMEQAESVVTLKVTKVGVLNRRDETVDGPKKPSRKWKQWGLILTSAQLLFFKDTIWTGALQSQIVDQMGDTQLNEEPIDVTISPRISYFRPDGVLSLNDAIAVCDDGSAKYENCFRLLAPQSGHLRQYLIQAPSADDMVDWMTKVNYCAAFRSVGIRRLDAFTLEERQALYDLQSRLGIDFATPDAPAKLAAASKSKKGRDLIEQVRESSAHLRNRLKERAAEIQPKLEQIEYGLEILLDELDEQLRLARHFNIMTPFQKSTRDRIEAAAVPLASAVRRLRLEAVKLDARRAVLAKDWELVTHIARAQRPMVLAEPTQASRLSPPPPARTETEGSPSGKNKGTHALKIDTTTAKLPSHQSGELTPMMRKSQDSDDERDPRSPTLRNSGSGKALALPAQTAVSGPSTPTWAQPSPAPSSAVATPSHETSDQEHLQERAAAPAQDEEAARWDSTAVAPDKRVSLATLPNISANELESLTKAHRQNIRRAPVRASVSSSFFTAPAFSANDPGPFG